MTICAFLFFGSVFAHQDSWVIKDYGNIKVRVKTGFEYEEINKAFIIGKLAEELSKKLNYKDQIFLDFNHHYTGNCTPDYFVSYDKGKIEYTWENPPKGNDFLEKKAIVIRQISRTFNFNSTLKLLEFSILNLKEIKKNQKQIEYNKNFCEWRINSIDTLLVKKEVEKQDSPILKDIQKIRIDRPNHEKDYGFSYYWQDNKFNIFLKYGTEDEKVVLKLDNIYEFKDLDGAKLVFDSDSTFHYISQYKTFVSKKQKIDNTSDYYRPYNVANIGGDKISIYFWNHTKEIGKQPKERTLLYLAKNDELIQDLDKLIYKE